MFVALFQSQHIGKPKYRIGQKAAVHVVQYCHGVTHGCHYFRMRVPKNAAHLTRREVKHWTFVRPVHLYPFRPMDDEVGKLAPIAENMIGHRCNLGTKKYNLSKYTQRHRRITYQPGYLTRIPAKVNVSGVQDRCRWQPGGNDT